VLAVCSLSAGDVRREFTTLTARRRPAARSTSLQSLTGHDSNMSHDPTEYMLQSFNNSVVIARFAGRHLRVTQD